MSLNLAASDRNLADRVLDALTDGVFVCDRDWKLTCVNPAGLLLCAQPQVELLGRCLWELFPGLRESAFGTHCLTSRQTGEPTSFEQLWSATGQWLEIRIFPDACMTSLLLRDITQARASREQLANAYHLYENAALMSSLGAWQFEPESGLVWWSQEIRTLYGLPADAGASYEAYAARVHPDDREVTLQALTEATNARRRIDLRHRIIRANDGAVRWLHQVGRVQPRDDGRLFYVGAAQDLTDDVERGRELANALDRALRAEDRLAGELSFSRAITHALTEGIYVLDTELRVVYMNPAAEHLLGARLDDCAGTVLLDRGGSDAATGREFDRPGRNALASSKPVVKDASNLRRADGSSLDAAYVATAMYSDTGLIGAVAVFRDVSAERKMRRLAQERDHLFQLADILFVVARHGEPVQVNPAAARALGLLETAPGGRHWAELMYAADVAPARRWYQQLEGGQPAAHGLFRIAGSDGQLRWIEWNGAHDEDATIYIVGRDVSSRIEGAEALRRANQELALRNEALEEFAVVASHDLQEPLRKICTFGGRLADRLQPMADPVAQDFLTRMIVAAERMRCLIEGLLQYSRAAQPASSEAIDLNPLTQDVLSDLEVQISSSGASIEIGLLPTVLGDPVQIRQILQNLIGNALKFVAPGASPNIRLYAAPAPAAGSEDAPRSSIVVEDQGVGFDPRFADRIFAPFERLHPQADYAGSGIGLAVVKRIVQRHGGTISANSRPGGGARIEFDLPIAAGDGAGSTQKAVR